MAESSIERYKVPDGLRPLLEALAREILRAQPTDLVNFSLLFFNMMQQHCLRNNIEDILKQPELYDSFQNDLQKQYHKKKNELAAQSSSSSLNEAATKIQAAFRGHIVSEYD
ncbi:unnamed protein product, partial [Thelazia callipaeda]|uniref:Sperm surface protein Sp17 n=1 Tax=Thelazia callipaeda TaxID=103827 RepID=A0A0N5CP58_THECL